VITDAFVFLDSEEAHSPVAVSHQSVPVRDPFKQIDQVSNNLAIASEEITVVVQVTA
jgi:D-alanyl-D-alanine carboxypeptidase